MLTHSPTQSVEHFEAEYVSALEMFLSGGGEAALQKAYELGRAAILADLGVLDVTELHDRAMKIALQGISPDEINQQMKNAMIFLEESLSPFEIAYRGYRDAVELMQRVANFAFIACHEIKSPLTLILSSASMLKDRLGLDEDSLEEKLIENVLDGVGILKSRTDDMMDIASLYSGALNIRTRPVNLQEFIHQVFEHLKTEVEWRGIKFNLYAARNLPEVQMDPDRIQQVITNLVQNAVKYAAEGGRIDLGVSADENDIMIEVRDHGKGIGPKEQEVLLTKDRPGKREDQAQGTGLGLILCRQIVQAHNGRIVLNSRPGMGSAFEVYLPLTGRMQVKD